MIPAKTIMQMATLGLSPAQAEAVSQMLIDVEAATKGDAAEAIESRRANDRERKQRQRHEKSRDITGQDVTERDTLSPKERSPTPPKEITPIPEKHSLRSCSSTAAPIDLVDRSAKAKAKAAEEIVFQHIGDGWNELARSCGLAEIQTIKGTRESQLRARVREIGDFGFDDPLSAFSTIFARVRGSPFLLGQDGRWKADFDFIVSPKGFTKILEGAYEVQGKSRAYA